MLRLKNIEWIGNAEEGHLRLLDQTRLPGEEVYLDCRDIHSVWQAIRRLSVRGAPAIGVAAAYGCVIGVQNAQDCVQALDQTCDKLATSRPTAVNLFWALDRMKRVEPVTVRELWSEARSIHEEDADMCHRIGCNALTLLDRHIISSDRGVLTHCNAGALATGGIGTATAPMYLAHERGQRIRVWADETRPLLQGARLTAYELAAADIDVTLICDHMAAQVMREGRIGMVITGADRIASNGDTANKIGTYSLAVLAKHHGIPFYVAAPSSTFDLSILDGSQIPIEQRAENEITEGFGMRTAPEGVSAYSPAFDVTPHGLISAIVTERGLIEPVNTQMVHQVIGLA